MEPDRLTFGGKLGEYCKIEAETQTQMSLFPSNLKLLHYIRILTAVLGGKKKII